MAINDNTINNGWINGNASIGGLKSLKLEFMVMFFSLTSLTDDCHEYLRHLPCCA